MPAKVDIYVDGSFQQNKATYGAVILLSSGKILHKLSGVLTEQETQGTRQVAGELAAVVKSVEWCLKYNISEIDIHYDYLGISEWVSGNWQAKIDLTRNYVKFMCFAKSKLKITFIKVKSHSGDYWNDYADTLAKEAK